MQHNVTGVRASSKRIRQKEIVKNRLFHRDVFTLMYVGHNELVYTFTRFSSIPVINSVTLE